MTQKVTPARSAPGLTMLRAWVAVSEPKQNCSTAISFRSKYSVEGKTTGKTSNHNCLRLCGPPPKELAGPPAPENLRAKSSPTSHFRQRTTPHHPHRNSLPRNLMHRACPARGISAMLPPSTGEINSALLRVRLALCESPIIGSDPRQIHSVVHPDRNDGLCREVHFIPFAGHDVGGASDQPYAETPRYMTEDGPDQCSSTGSDGFGQDVALDIMLGFDHPPLIDLDVFPGLPRLFA